MSDEQQFPVSPLRAELIAQRLLVPDSPLPSPATGYPVLRLDHVGRAAAARHIQAAAERRIRPPKRRAA